MSFDSILLTIFQRLHGERSAQGVYHILRGKKSGQTLQDVEYYQVKSYYALLPHLTASEFQQALERMQADDLIYINELVYVTAKGQMATGSEMWRFNGWNYRGLEREFARRLALLVQTLSNLRSGETMFMPIQKELPTQQFIKGFLRNQSSSMISLSTSLRKELEYVFTHSSLSDLQCTIVSGRLTGYKLTGSTWEQMADRLNMSVKTIQLYYLEALHMLLDYLQHHPNLPLLSELAIGCRVDTYLTQSAERTQKLFERGYSVEQIASLRNLKLSTIEDHFIEMAANMESFPYKEFITEEQRDTVWRHVEQLQTKRLRLLKQQCPELSYFQLRLIIIIGRRES
ncbi:MULTISPECIES: helix-turn-helix domain-containing protein [unclassified Sporosarcina]|uniref:helix-turn-helix domain-containing protein n=1 Tax=unclassified Sporosarcina TaxID=2647733 RepID=UPI000C16D2D6|nr:MULTISPECIES: helix-turn-helix domain-containing protein [unclassified Sporosarcina]PID00594.1 recombinase RecQ [Sporosarcina sp. P29]PID05192.1 recombinase RecQ [Sporosarcina sp. P30]PID08466.1 recombinase RecQ [Sporosarcina sp. P31]PID11541.1 recombinase RecQ [Sporosarcina sp. P32b]